MYSTRDATRHKLVLAILSHTTLCRAVQDRDRGYYSESHRYGKFERSVAGLTAIDQTKFFSENFLRLWPDARVS